MQAILIQVQLLPYTEWSGDVMSNVSTEVAIATTTLGSANVNIDFTSIPNTYTDLRIVLTARITSGGNAWMQFNGDTGANYSFTRIYGDGSSAASDRGTGYSRFQLSTGSVSPTIPQLFTVDIFSYAGSTNKTILVESSQDTNGAGNVTRWVELWRNTSAITSIKLIALSDTFTSGTTATLYGIL